MIQRLIIAYIRYDRNSTMVFRGGLVAKAPQSGVAKLQIEHSELRQADADATTAEMELGITPRRRGSVAKVKRADKLCETPTATSNPYPLNRPDNPLRVGYCTWPDPRRPFCYPGVWASPEWACRKFLALTARRVWRPILPSVVEGRSMILSAIVENVWTSG